MSSQIIISYFNLNFSATLKVAGSLEKSTEVMVAMQHLVKLPEISATMREMSKEMMKAGILEEMIDETMESLEDTEEIEEEAQSEIDRVLWELTAGKLGVCTFLLCCLKKLDIIFNSIIEGSTSATTSFCICSNSHCYRNK